MIFPVVNDIKAEADAVGECVSVRGSGVGVRILAGVGDFVASISVVSARLGVFVKVEMGETGGRPQATKITWSNSQTVLHRFCMWYLL
jgi:hypothetical protein